jgi:hypothetical protein
MAAPAIVRPNSIMRVKPMHAVAAHFLGFDPPRYVGDVPNFAIMSLEDWQSLMFDFTEAQASQPILGGPALA